MKKKNVLIAIPLIVVFFLLIVLLIKYAQLSHIQLPFLPNSQKTSNTSSVKPSATVASEYSDLKVTIPDEPQTISYFKDTHVIDSQNVTTVEIKIVSSIPNPFFTQEDDDGTEIISSSFEVTDTHAVILIHPGTYVMGLPPERKASFINDQISKNLNILAKRNTKQDKDIEKKDVISVE